jgi:hypothetical protein
MTTNNLPDADHVVRYARFIDILDDGTLNCSAFQLRKTESGLSVNWLECFDDKTKSQQLDEVRRLTRLTMKRSGRLAELNVGITRRNVDQLLDELRFIHMPLEADENFEADPSHSEILGLPPKDSPEADLIGDLIANCVIEVHSAME